MRVSQAHWWTPRSCCATHQAVTSLPEGLPDLDNLDIAEAVECIDAVYRILSTVDDCLGVITQLEKALESRDIIGQAKGLLMAQGISADEAFDILRRVSQRTNQRLRNVAADVVAKRAAQGMNRPPRAAPD